MFKTEFYRIDSEMWIDGQIYEKKLQAHQPLGWGEAEVEAEEEAEAVEEKDEEQEQGEEGVKNHYPQIKSLTAVLSKVQ